jgi:hypothetical protein
MEASVATRSQVRYSEHQSERLYSASLTAEDLDNFLSHRRDARARTRARGCSELTCDALQLRPAVLDAHRGRPDGVPDRYACRAC